MDPRAMALLLQMLELRKERAAMASRRARQDFLKAHSFSQQVDAYAQEYDRNWSRSVVNGDEVAHLQSQAAFTNRLQVTAGEQRLEAQALERESQVALSRVAQEAERVQAVRQWMLRQDRRRRAEQDRRDERTLEDVLQARLGGGGTQVAFSPLKNQGPP